MMKSESAFSNFLWRLMERCGAQAVSLVVSIILARLLDPVVYGTVALVTVIIAILQVFVDSGLGNALIQKKDADNKDFSTVFFFNLVVCIVLYFVLFWSAPYIAQFYETGELTAIIRVLGLSLVVSSVKNIQQAYVSRNMIFKKFFFATLLGTIGAAILGISMAYKGFGVWALVAQNLFNLTIDTIVLWVTVRWRPELYFSLNRLKTLFSFGSKLLVSRLISSLYSNARQMLIGKVYSSTDLAFYNRGYDLPAKIVPNIVTAINSVMLPILSKEQDNKKHVLSMVRRASKLSSFIVWPAMVGMASCGELLVKVMLTEKWLECVPFLWIFCIDYALWPMIYVYNNAINALGRSDIYLKIQIAQKIVGIIALIISMHFNVLMIAVCVPFISLIELFMILNCLNKLLDYSFADQIKDTIPPIILSLVMGVVILIVNPLSLHDATQLLLDVIVGVIFYLGMARWLKMESYVYVSNLILGYLKRKKI